MTIERTVRSVDTQSFYDYEHLIIDGSSTDDTLSIIKRFENKRRVVVSERDKGIYDAMNKGLHLAKGQFVVFLNAGDKFHAQNSLEIVAANINDNCDIVYGQTNLVDNSGRYLAPRHLSAPANLTANDFARGMLVCHQAFIVRKSICPDYDLQYRFSADYDWCIRCLQQSRCNAFIDEVLVDYLSEGMTTANRRKSLIERFRIMSKYFGFWSTLLRHFGFIGRFIKHEKTLKNA